MGLSIRTLFIWLLVLAVPAQGAAAATMAFCGPNHQGGGATAPAHAGLDGAHSHPGVDAPSAHDHHAMAAQAELDVGAAANSATAAAAPAKAVPADNHKCSACASCCSVAAILNTVPSVPAPGPTSTVLSAVVATVDAFAAGGPDRPPRSALA